MAEHDHAPPLRHYWDAGVFTAFIDDEPGRADVVGGLLAACNEGRLEIFTSHLSIAEVAYSVVERAGAQLLPDEEDRIDGLWAPPSKIKLVEVSALIALEARELLRKSVPNKWTGLKAADAIHLATAKRLGAIAYCATYDEKWMRYGEMCGVSIGQPQPLPRAPR